MRFEPFKELLIANHPVSRGIQSLKDVGAVLAHFEDPSAHFDNGKVKQEVLPLNFIVFHFRIALGQHGGEQSPHLLFALDARSVHSVH